MPFNKKEYKRKYYQKNRDKYLERYRANREQRRTYQSERYRRNREVLLEKQTEYDKAHLQARKIHHHKRRLRMKDGDLTREQWREILEHHDYKCVLCGDPYAHMDHIIPLSKGGRHTASNVQPLCAKCNLTKGSRP